MIKYGLFLFIFIILSHSLKAQSICSSFALEGTINSDTGKIILMAINDNIYYPNNVNQEAMIVKGKFKFTNSISYPYAVQLGLKVSSQWKYLSDVFFIEPGTQAIFCDIDSNRGIPVLKNNSMEELRGSYFNSFNSLQPEFNSLYKTKDSLYSVYHGNIPDTLSFRLSEERIKLKNKSDSIILGYIIKHPNSYVGLWELINFLSNSYNPVLDSAYNLFTDSIKNTYTGKILAEKLRTTRATAIGNKFPTLFLANTKSINVNIPQTNDHSKYMLIDFWYSHCPPCIAQFSTLKEIYKKYKNKGFDIIGISTDRESDKGAWQNVIKNYDLTWSQYWDINGTAAHELSIIDLPTNFLLDYTGRIIMRDITPELLQKFLEQKIDTK